VGGESFRTLTLTNLTATGNTYFGVEAQRATLTGSTVTGNGIADILTRSAAAAGGHHVRDEPELHDASHLGRLRERLKVTQGRRSFRDVSRQIADI
jgi:hypothetical protein